MRFTVIVRPDGKALLTTTEKMPLETLRALREHLADWDQGHVGIAVIPDCDVIQVSEISIDLGEPAPHRAEGKG